MSKATPRATTTEDRLTEYLIHSAIDYLGLPEVRDIIRNPVEPEDDGLSDLAMHRNNVWLVADGLGQNVAYQHVISWLESAIAEWSHDRDMIRQLQAEISATPR